MFPHILTVILQELKTIMNRKFLHAIAALFVSWVVQMAFVAQSAAESPIDLSQTVEHLIDYVAKSGRTFIRNGQENDSTKAAEHIRSKFNYYKDSISTPEDFIEKAASKSLMSGQPYLVKFADGTTEPVSEWLSKELAVYRKSIHSP